MKFLLFLLPVTLALRVSLRMASSIDPNFEAHLGSMLKAGMAADRPSYDIGSELRKRYKNISTIKKEAAAALKSTNSELAVELEELADELDETTEQFVAMAALHDETLRGPRPSPDLAKTLRAAEEAKKDPNFQEHLGAFLKKGTAERPDADLPSALRLMKYKQSTQIKRLAANELRPKNPKLAQTLDEIANEMDESHERFLEMAANMAAMKADAQPYSPRAM